MRTVDRAAPLPARPNPPFQNRMALLPIEPRRDAGRLKEQADNRRLRNWRVPEPCSQSASPLV